eukprot:scaffold1733_cov257-Pinguiococcus_pyrenoidosus.AAC.6
MSDMALAVDNRLYDKLRCRLSRDDDFRGAFQMLLQASGVGDHSDKNSGALTFRAPQLRRAFRSLLSQSLSHAETEALFKRMDVDGDGVLSQADLQSWVHNHKTQSTWLVKKTPQYLRPLKAREDTDSRVEAKAARVLTLLQSKVEGLRGGASEAITMFPHREFLSPDDFAIGTEKLVGPLAAEVIDALLKQIGVNSDGNLPRIRLLNVLNGENTSLDTCALGAHCSGLKIHQPGDKALLASQLAANDASQERSMPSWVAKGGAKRYHESTPAWEASREKERFRKTAEASRVPGYTGYVPGVKLTIGDTFGRAAHKSMTLNRREMLGCLEKPVLPDALHYGTSNSHERWGLPGYGGYMAGMQSDALVGMSPWANHILFPDDYQHGTSVQKAIKSVKEELKGFVEGQSSLLEAFKELGADEQNKIPKAVFLQYLQKTTNAGKVVTGTSKLAMRHSSHRIVTSCP